MRQAFAQPGFRRLFAAMAASMLGDALMLLVLSMWVKDLTGSNGKAGFTFFWMVLPSVVAPAYGVLLDRVRRLPLLVWGNLASALMLLPLLLVRDAGDVWIIYLVAFGYGISFVVLPAALNGLLKELLAEDLLVQANSSLQTFKEGCRLIGPLAGAGLFALLGGGAVALVDAVSFLVAAGLIATIAVAEEQPEPSQGGWLSEVGAGVRHLLGDFLLRHVLVALMLMLLVLGFVEASIYALLDHYGKPVTFAGVLVTVQGVGAIAGGLTVPWWVRRLGEPGTLALGLAGIGAGAGLIAVAPSLPLVMAAMLPLGYGIPMLLVAFTTLLQVRTPQRLMGRVSATTETLLGTPQALSLAVGAALVVLVDFRVIFAVVAAFCLLGVVYLQATLRGLLWRPAVAEVVGDGPAEAAPA